MVTSIFDYAFIGVMALVAAESVGAECNTPDTSDTSAVVDIHPIPQQPMFFYKKDEFILYARPESLIRRLQFHIEEWKVRDDEVLLSRLRQELPLDEHSDLSNIVWLPRHNSPPNTRRVDLTAQLFYLFANLAEAGDIHIFDGDSETFLECIVVRKFSTPDQGGKRFTRADGKLIFQTIDWVH